MKGGTVEILSLIDKVESLLTAGARLPGTRKVLVDIDRILDIVDQMRLSVPKDVQEAGEILMKREGVINQALLEARRIKASAEEESRAKVEQSEVLKQAGQKSEEIIAEARKKSDGVVQEANRRAQHIVQDAQTFADARIAEADKYTQEVLYKLEQDLSMALNSVRRGLDLLDRQGEVKAG